MGLLGLLLLLLVSLSPAIPLAGAGAGVLRQVVGGDDGGGTSFEPFNVTYDHRALILGGKRRMLVSAGLHYPRATPEVSSEVPWRFAFTGPGAAAVGRGSGAPRGVLTLVVAAALIAGILRSQFLVRAGRLGSAAAAVGRAFPITSEYVPFYS
jgi:hypothetical protein